MLQDNEKPVSVGEIKYFYGNYRGTVVSNYDPLTKPKGRLKIYVPGVYPEELAKNPKALPWAEPAMGLFGGSWTNEREGDLNTETGVTTIPHTSSEKLKGAELWVFFEQGNWNRPIYFAACQGGDGWHSEHNNQHVIKTDNVRIRVDENPGHKDSTCKFNSYNSTNVELSEKKQISKMPTRVDVEIWNEGGSAINVQIKGNVNMKIEGDIFETHIGDKHLYHKGNLYKRHDGDVREDFNGNIVKKHIGETTIKNVGEKTYIQTGDDAYTNTHGDVSYTINDGKFDHYVDGDIGYKATGSVKCDYDNDFSLDIASAANIKVAGYTAFTFDELKISTSEDFIMTSASGNMVMQAMGSGPYTTKDEDNPNKLRGGIILNGNYIKQSGNGTLIPTPWIYQYDPTQTDTIPPIPGIEDNTGTTIHHFYGYSSDLEYNKKES